MMRRKISRHSGLTSVFSISLLLAIYAGNSSGQDFATIMGKQEYRFYCASCHGREGEGDGRMAANLTIKPINLKQISKRRGGEFPKEDIYRIIDGRETIRAHGSAEMPVWGDAYSEIARSMFGGEKKSEKILTEQNVKGRILSLIYYLQSIQIP